mmetsp:Transcript_49206/g.130295  ORF Transcript_49206/g.130295 Transcript_49206/m.130295 type:complete len:260 (-) Transcript_49206:2244-3023(-)
MVVPKLSTPSSSCRPPAERRSVSPLPLANMLSVKLNASTVPRRISATIFGSTFDASGMGDCDRLKPPAAASPACRRDSSIRDSPLLANCLNTSSKLALTRNSSSTLRAIFGRNDEASAPATSTIPFVPETGFRGLLPRKPPASLSEPLSADELLGLICVASAMPGKGMSVKVFLSLAGGLFAEGSRRAEAVPEPTLDGDESPLSPPRPKNDEREVRVRERSRASPSLPGLAFASAVPSLARRACLCPFGHVGSSRPSAC